MIGKRLQKDLANRLLRCKIGIGHQVGRTFFVDRKPLDPLLQHRAAGSGRFFTYGKEIWHQQASIVRKLPSTATDAARRIMQNALESTDSFDAGRHYIMWPAARDPATAAMPIGRKMALQKAVGERDEKNL